MNKGELVDAIVRQTGTTKAQAEAVVNSAISIIQDQVASGRVVTLLGFGTFRAGLRKERTGRNPKTGEILTIPQAIVPKFQPGKAFKELVKENET
jgi:DNA-binding protein HU-beta